MVLTGGSRDAAWGPFGTLRGVRLRVQRLLLVIFNGVINYALPAAILSGLQKSALIHSCRPP